MSSLIDLGTLSKKKIVEEIINNHDLKLDILKNMDQFGGSFVKALAECMRRADSSNLKILVENFTHYLISYQPRNFPNSHFKGGGSLR